MPKDSAEEIRDYFRSFDKYSPETKRAILLYEDVQKLLRLLRCGSARKAIALLKVRERALFLQLQALSR